MVEVGGRELGETRGELERQRMGETEGRREVELGRLALDRLDDRLAVMAGVAAPEARRRVEDLAPLRGVIVHVLRAGDQPRALLEGAVWRERQPEGFEIVGDVRSRRGGRV